MKNLFALAAALLLIPGCSPKDDPGDTGGGSGDAVSAKKTRGDVAPGADTLMLSYPNDPDTINPIISSDTVGEAFMRWVVEGLADQKFSNPDELEPMLAESWTFDEPNLEYTVKLRKGVKWQPTKFPDGSPIPAAEFTAHDVKFTFDCVFNKHVNAAPLRSYYEDPDAKEESDRIKVTVSVVDDYTIKVKWKKPYFLAELWTLGLPVLPKHVYSVDEKGEPLSLDVTSEEFARGFNEHWHNSMLCGTGPMKLKEWKKNERLVLERNDDYWGAPFYFSSVVFRNVPNSNTALQMMLKNELDWNSISDKSLYMQTKKEAAVKAGKVSLVEFDYPAYRYIGWNMKRDIFKEAEVRRALAHGIPVQRIIDKVLHGLGKPLSGPFLPGSTAYDDSLELLGHAPDRAKEILEKAGWKDSNGNGIRDKKKEGKTLELQFDLMIYADAPMYQTIAEIVKEEYRRIGVDVQISPVKWALMLDKLKKKEFDACMLGWALSWRMDPFQIWHGSHAETPESSNAIGYKNPEVDKLIETLRVTFDRKKQVEIYRKIHKLIYDDQPYAFLFVDKATGGLDSRIENVSFYKIRPCRDHREWFAGAETARK